MSKRLPPPQLLPPLSSSQEGELLSRSNTDYFSAVVAPSSVSASSLWWISDYCSAAFFSFLHWKEFLSFPSPRPDVPGYLLEGTLIDDVTGATQAYPAQAGRNALFEYGLRVGVTIEIQRVSSPNALFWTARAAPVTSTLSASSSSLASQRGGTELCPV